MNTLIDINLGSVLVFFLGINCLIVALLIATSKIKFQEKWRQEESKFTKFFLIMGVVHIIWGMIQIVRAAWPLPR